MILCSICPFCLFTVDHCSKKKDFVDKMGNQFYYLLISPDVKDVEIFESSWHKGSPLILRCEGDFHVVLMFEKKCLQI